jgi:hypothetical protein
MMYISPSAVRMLYITFMAPTVVLFTLRFISRVIVVKKPGSDDIAAFFAFVSVRRQHSESTQR